MTMRPETDPLEFPAEPLATRLSWRLESRQGRDGIIALVERLRGHWPYLRAAWADRAGPEGPRAFGAALMRAAESSDRNDLVGHDIRLRTLRGDGRPDANVLAKIGGAVLETLADEDRDIMLEVLSRIAACDDIATKRLAHAIAIPLLVAAKQFDAAIAAAKWNRGADFCPTSEHQLFESVAAKQRSGLPIDAGDASVQDLSDRFCSQPFDTLSTANGRGKRARVAFFACRCAATLPYPLSYDEDALDIDALWNGADIREIRRSILDGDFTYCSRTMCPYIAQGTLPKRSEIEDPVLRDIIDHRRTEVDAKPSWVMLGHDQSCNLACPSCRSEILALGSEERDKLDRFTEKVLLPLLADSAAYLLVSADGDPFASKHYRKLIRSLDAPPYAGVKLALLTNGLLFTRDEWASLGKVQKSIERVSVSIDGARPETYETLRYPGKWSTITENMEFLASLRRDGEIQSLILHFVVQDNNFMEMAEFVALGKSWGVDGVIFIRLLNMGVLSAETFVGKDVSDPRHPLHAQFLEVLRHPMLHEPEVNLLSLAPLQQAADESCRETARAPEADRPVPRDRLHRRVSRWISARVLSRKLEA